MSIGASYTFKQNYPAFEYNSTIADPTSPNYGLHRDARRTTSTARWCWRSAPA